MGTKRFRVQKKDAAGHLLDPEVMMSNLRLQREAAMMEMATQKARAAGIVREGDGVLSTEGTGGSVSASDAGDGVSSQETTSGEAATADTDDLEVSIDDGDGVPEDADVDPFA